MAPTSILMPGKVMARQIARQAPRLRRTRYVQSVEIIEPVVLEQRQKKPSGPGIYPKDRTCAPNAAQSARSTAQGDLNKSSPATSLRPLWHRGRQTNPKHWNVYQLKYYLDNTIKSPINQNSLRLRLRFNRYRADQSRSSPNPRAAPSPPGSRILPPVRVGPTCGVRVSRRDTDS